MLGGIAIDRTDVVLLVRSNDSAIYLRHDLCRKDPPTRLLSREADQFLAVPSVVHDTTLLIIAHNQQRAVRLDLSSGTSREIWLSPHVEASTPIRYVVGAIFGGRVAWRINSLKDSVAFLPPFERPWVLGERIDGRIDSANIDLPLSTGVRVQSRGAELWAVQEGQAPVRLNLDSSGIIRRTTAASCRATRVMLAPDGAVWLSTSRPGSTSIWQIRRGADCTSPPSCARVEGRVLAAVSADELLVANSVDEKTKVELHRTEFSNSACMHKP